MQPAPIRDGLKAKMGDLTWPIVRDKVDGVVTVVGLRKLSHSLKAPGFNP
jgi:hypothetical protein